MRTVTTEPRSARSARLEARITREQKALLERAASLRGRSLTDFVVSAAEEAAARIVREREVLTLSARDRKAFVAALLKPPTLRGRLARTVKRSKRTLAARGE